MQLLTIDNEYLFEKVFLYDEYQNGSFVPLHEMTKHILQRKNRLQENNLPPPQEKTKVSTRIG